MGLTVMARLLHEVATAANLWSWQQAVFTGELGDWLGGWHSLETGTEVGTEMRAAYDQL